MAQVVSTMAGTLLEICVQVGDTIEPGQDVAMLESMKMQMYVQAEVGGTVKALCAESGDFVNEGDPIIELA
ncbi:MAG: biotin/lipoyl-containing protein [bacterium]|jgi:acetyl-CoA carboxylase biotin carboxyl carrier protein|nr:biotin/lipoyl-containing protein [bacterium]